MIKTVIDKISDWSKLSIEQRYNFLLGVVVVALMGVVYFQEQKRADLMAKCELEQKEHLNYLKQLDVEYRILLRELNNIKSEK